MGSPYRRCLSAAPPRPPCSVCSLPSVPFFAGCWVLGSYIVFAGIFRGKRPPTPLARSRRVVWAERTHGCLNISHPSKIQRGVFSEAKCVHTSLLFAVRKCMRHFAPLNNTIGAIWRNPARRFISTRARAGTIYSSILLYEKGPPAQRGVLDSEDRIRSFVYQFGF